MYGEITIAPPRDRRFACGGCGADVHLASEVGIHSPYTLIQFEKRLCTNCMRALDEKNDQRKEITA
ncbi:hypothetical protein [Bradyrhizobium sp. Tv2a-2]|uniref:hypothetical protein n=1 Tax=Bradyrhizobium sp. Tv2a-2 TaxID=113395 RepID=UPI0004678424|nr:hypothetical protein [Bradyrhizobium sp. Tv2a-2]